MVLPRHQTTPSDERGPNAAFVKVRLKSTKRPRRASALFRTVVGTDEHERVLSQIRIVSNEVKKLAELAIHLLQHRVI